MQIKKLSGLRNSTFIGTKTGLDAKRFPDCTAKTEGKPKGLRYDLPVLARDMATKLEQTMARNTTNCPGFPCKIAIKAVLNLDLEVRNVKLIRGLST